MPRILSIDYGSKRTGLAVTDPQKKIATGLTGIHTKDLENFLTEYFKKEEVEKGDYWFSNKLLKNRFTHHSLHR